MAGTSIILRVEKRLVWTLVRCGGRSRHRCNILLDLLMGDVLIPDTPRTFFKNPLLSGIRHPGLRKSAFIPTATTVSKNILGRSNHHGQLAIARHLFVVGAFTAVS
jgi:hypothetical protein